MPDAARPRWLLNGAQANLADEHIDRALEVFGALAGLDWSPDASRELGRAVRALMALRGGAASARREAMPVSGRASRG